MPPCASGSSRSKATEAHRVGHSRCNHRAKDFHGKSSSPAPLHGHPGIPSCPHTLSADRLTICTQFVSFFPAFFLFDEQSASGTKFRQTFLHMRLAGLRNHHLHVETTPLERESILGVIHTQSTADALGRFEPEATRDMFPNDNSLSLHFSLPSHPPQRA